MASEPIISVAEEAHSIVDQTYAQLLVMEIETLRNFVTSHGINESNARHVEVREHRHDGRKDIYFHGNHLGTIVTKQEGLKYKVYVEMPHDPLNPTRGRLQTSLAPTDLLDIIDENPKVILNKPTVEDMFRKNFNKAFYHNRPDLEVDGTVRWNCPCGQENSITIECKESELREGIRFACVECKREMCLTGSR